MKKNINFFHYLWNTIINKIKHSRGDDIIFDDNEVIIKDWNKIRFSSVDLVYLYLMMFLLIFIL